MSDDTEIGMKPTLGLASRTTGRTTLEPNRA
jgi:hypothetical protein